MRVFVAVVALAIVERAEAALHFDAAREESPHEGVPAAAVQAFVSLVRLCERGRQACPPCGETRMRIGCRHARMSCVANAVESVSCHNLRKRPRQARSMRHRMGIASSLPFLLLLL